MKFDMKLGVKFAVLVLPLSLMAVISCGGGGSDDSSSAEPLNVVDTSALSDTSDITDISGKGIHEDFQPTVDRFLREAWIRGLNPDITGLDIQYGDPGDGAIGICYYLGTDTRDILIHPDRFEADPLFMQEVIMHELGHCILQRPHIDDPNSIMCPVCSVGDPWVEGILNEFYGATPQP